VIDTRHHDAIAGLDRMRAIAQHHVTATFEDDDHVDRVPVMQHIPRMFLVRVTRFMVDDVPTDLTWRQAVAREFAFPGRRRWRRALIYRIELGDTRAGYAGDRGVGKLGLAHQTGLTAGVKAANNETHGRYIAALA
jgi:hypothetical protein